MPNFWERKPSYRYEETKPPEKCTRCLIKLAAKDDYLCYTCRRYEETKPPKKCSGCGRNNCNCPW